MAINRAVMAAIKAISFTDIDIRKSYRAERQLQAIGAKLKVKRFNYTTWDRNVYCHNHIVPVRVYPPPNAESNRPVLIFFHGGGWVTGNIDTYDSVCCDMARLTECWVVSVDYRLAPENPFPAGLEDCYAITKALYQERLPGAGDSVTIIGDSAGGNLAAALSLMARDRGEFNVSGQILIYPALNNNYGPNSQFPSVIENGTEYLLTAKRISDFLELYRSQPEDLENPYFAPLLAESFENQPRTLIITAQFDPLRDEAEFYGKKLRLAGNDVTVHRLSDGIHGCFTLPASFAYVKEIYRVIREFLDGEGDGAVGSTEKLDKA